MSNGNYKQVFFLKMREISRKNTAISREIANKLAETVVILTPVDTTRAEANWIAALNTIPQEFDEAKRNSGGSRANLDDAKTVIAQMKTGDVFVIANSTPYIFRLEKGWSQQAPNGMVAVTVAMFRQMVKRATQKVGLKG